jgi:DNA-binding Lrp family transcriptional regulator
MTAHLETPLCYISHMAKNSIKQIAVDEKKILEELSKNANKSINEIAKKCGFSRQKVWRIIKSLEKNNTIWGYTAVIDEEKLDKKGFIILIKRTNEPLSKDIIDKIVTRELIEKSSNSGIDILNSIYTNGAFDWVLCFTADNIKQAKVFVEEINTMFKGYIAELYLLEKMFTTEECGISNPNTAVLRDFFDL